MGTSEGSIGSTTNITGNGDPAYKLVVMGDGYTSSELSKYRADVDKFVQALFATKPFAALTRAIDVYRVEVRSNDSGADDPSDGDCTGTGAKKSTYFDSTFCWDDIPRALFGNVPTVVATAKATVPTWKVAVVLVNTTTPGGMADVGNRVCFASPANLETIIHELGHAAFALADEYETLRGCNSGETDRDMHPAVEPAYPNVTVTKSPLKWMRFVTASPTPQMSNRNPCTMCDGRTSSTQPPDAVGLFEGADTYHCGAYRPQFDCKMRTLGTGFCLVCQQRIITRLAWRLRSAPFASPHSGWVLDAAAIASGGMVQQFPPHGGSNQRFKIEPVPSPGGVSRYRVRVPSTDLVLDVAGGSTSPGAPLQLFPWHGGPNQLFTISTVAGGYSLVMAVHSNLYLEVPTGSPSSGTALVQNTFNTLDNQKWVPFLNMQPGWRQCLKCHGLFFVVHSTGSCPAGGAHDPSQSRAYLLSNNNLSLANWEDGWRWCRLCQGLFRLSVTRPCPAGGAHDPSQSGGYSLPVDMLPSGAESRWYQCEKCSGLFGGQSGSVCPADNKEHDPGFAFVKDHSLAFT